MPHDYSVQSPQNAFESAYQFGEQIAARRKAQEREVAESYARAQAEIQQQRLDLAADVRKEVGRLLAMDDCTGAKRLALSSGDIALANQVKAYCTIPEH